MRKIYHILTILVVSIIIASCTHNNGDVGEYFGTWKLENISVNGENDAAYVGDIFWKFQSSVFCMEQVNDRFDTENRWGTWMNDGKMLRLDFSHYDDAHPEGADFYSPFPVTRIPNGVTDLSIISMFGSSMQLQYTGEDGNVVGYKLKKW